MDFAKKRCIPCEGNVPPLTLPQAQDFMQHISGWTLSPDGAHIFREFMFKDFDETMQFVNMVAELAETEGHHPDMQVSYGKVRLELTTHAIGGLSENDIILAAKINEIERE